MRSRRMQLVIGLIVAGFAALAASSPAGAAEQTVLENPPIDGGTGICPPNGGVIGQTFTLQDTAALSSIGFWLGTEGNSGTSGAATLSVGWWVEGGLRPFVVQDVTLDAQAEPTLTTLTPAAPIPLLPNTMFGVELDFHGMGACPVTFSPGAAYEGGFAVIGGQQAEGDLAFQFGLSPVDEPGPEEPGPEQPATIIGDPSTQPATVGCPYSYQFQVVGVPDIFVQDFQVPGLVLDAEGLISGTPTEVRKFSQTVRIFDGTVTDGHNVTVIVNEQPATGCPGVGAPTPLPPTTSPPAAPGESGPTAGVGPASKAAPKLAASGTDPTAALVLGAASLAAGAIAGLTALLGRTRRQARR